MIERSSQAAVFEAAQVSALLPVLKSVKVWAVGPNGPPTGPRVVKPV